MPKQPDINAVLDVVAAKHRPPFMLRINDRGCVNGIIDALRDAPRLKTRRFMSGILSNDPHRRYLGFLTSPQDLPFIIPLANFIDAADFVSWEDGRGKANPKIIDAHAYSSRELIRSYARRKTAFPAIPRAEVGVQPDGLPLFVAHDGAHRTAAAHRRKDTVIMVLDLMITRLTQNLVEP